MNTLFRLALLTSLVVLAAAPSRADERSFHATAKSGSKEHRAEALRTVARKAVDRILKDEGLEDRIAGEAREGLISTCEKLVVSPRFRERRGKWRFSGKVDLERVRAAVIVARDGASGGKTVQVVAIVLVGGQPAPPEIRDAVSEVFRKSGYAVLDVDPKAAPKGALVATLKVGVKFEASAPGSAEAVMCTGRYRVQGTAYQAFSPTTGSVLFRGQLRSDASKTDYDESDERSLAEPRVRKGEAQAPIGARYAIHAARWAARLSVKKLNAQAADKGPNAQARYTLRLKGFSEAEVKALHEALAKREDVAELKDLGALKALRIARLKIRGDAESVVEVALGAAKLKAKINRSGVTLTLIRR